VPAWLEAILLWIQAHPQTAGLIIAIVSFLEGFAVIGILVPGIIILFGFGTLVGLGVLELWSVWLWCSVGAILGDGLSFWLGHHFKDHISDIWPFNRSRGLLNRGQQFFKRHGLKSVVIGRFIGPVRPIMPVIAGMMQMNLRAYIPANIIAGILWAPAYLLPGVVFGASLEIAKVIALRLALLMAVVVGTIWLTAWLVNRLSAWLAPRTARMLSFALAWSSRHPLLGRPARALVDPSRPDSGTLLLFAVTLLLTAWGLLTLMIALPHQGGMLPFDEPVMNAMQALRTPWADQVMLFLDGFGSLVVLLPIVVFTLIYLLWRKRRLAALHWLVATLTGLLLALLFDLLLGGASGPVVEAIGQPIRPNMHLVFSLVVYGFFAVIIARQFPRRRRVWPYWLAATLVSLIALARLYFNLSTPSSMLAGVLLGLLWVSIIGIGYRRRLRRPFWNRPLAWSFYALTLILAVTWVKVFGDQALEAYRSNEPAAIVSVEQWQAGSVPGLEVEAHDFTIAGDLEALIERLKDSGWQEAETADWSTALAMMQPEPVPETLTILPRLFNNRSEAIIMQRWSDDGPHQVVRIWPLNAQLDDGRPLYSGTVRDHALRRIAVMFQYWSELDSPMLPEQVLNRLSLPVSPSEDEFSIHY